MIPDGWEIKCGEDIASKITKGQSPKWQGFEYQDSGTLFVTSENVRDGRIDVSKPKYLPLAFNNKLKGSQLKKNDILINIVGASIGRSCQFNLDTEHANINQAVCLFRLKSNINHSYIVQFLQLPSTISTLIGTQTESARPNLSLADIREFKFLLPPLLEQCRIAEVLGVWDESIDLLEKLIGRVRSRKQGLMQQLLTGKKRFKEFEGSEWKKVSLEKIADINPRSHPNNLQFVGEFVEMASVSESGHLKNVALVDLDNSTSGYTTFINGDTLVAKITPCFENGKGALIEGLQGIGFGSTEFFVLRAKLEIIPIYLYYLTRTYDFGMRGKAMMQGSGGQQRVPSDFIRQFAVKLPSIPEQEKIAALLSAADEEISTLEKQLATYKQQKLGLMQQLLTGRIRI
jgi:type I restriction enzyme, S subunit